jgi:hypothetical protein
MTIRKDDIITLPTWMVVLLLPIVVSAVISFGVFKASAAQQKEKVDNVINTTNELKQNKVDRNEFIMIQNQLNRIEEKVDKDIINNK